MYPEKIKSQVALVNGLWDTIKRSAAVSGGAAAAAKMAELASDAALGGWHGYAWHQEKTEEEEGEFVFTFFVQTPADLDRVLDRIAKLVGGVRVQAVIAPPFRQMAGASPAPQSAVLQPGNVVFSTNDFTNCPFSCVGTIGAFLVGAQADGTQTTWLLSNRHVLAECASASHAFGANRTKIGADIRRVPPQADNTFLVDAAVVKIENPSLIDPAYPGLGPLINPAPNTPPELQQGDIIQKVGSTIPHHTSGSFVFHCPRVTVSHCSKTGSEVYQDQLAFVSADANNPFAQEGDSGSLVVKGQTPVGLLFATTVKADPAVPIEQKFKLPFFLANPWDVVIQEVSALVGSPLELMLQPVSPAVSAPVSASVPPVNVPVSTPPTPPAG
jgi:Trypsin